ncbi:MAG: hypothetical protein L0Z50_38655 [Verrucomicrobiales bacterium]|nr:hypothetical protein [Verrucomicrobiales bacterium]
MNRSAAILAAAGWNGAMCFVAQRFGWVKPAAARMAALRFVAVESPNSSVLLARGAARPGVFICTGAPDFSLNS